LFSNIVKEVFMANSVTIPSQVNASIVTNQSNIANAQSQIANNQVSPVAGVQGIVTQLSSQASNLTANGANITQASNVVRVSQTALQQISGLLKQLQSLASSSNSSTTSPTDKAALQQSFSSIAGQVSNLVQSASVNGSNLLNSNNGLSIQTGLGSDTSSSTTVSGFSLNNLVTALSSLNISANALAVPPVNPYFSPPSAFIGATNLGAAEALSVLQQSLTTVSNAQASLTASQTNLQTLQTENSSTATGLDNSVNALQTFIFSQRFGKFE
jgi:flagellin-like hook-associated protein FlgL